MVEDEAFGMGDLDEPAFAGMVPAIRAVRDAAPNTAGLDLADFGRCL